MIYRNRPEENPAGTGLIPWLNRMALASALFALVLSILVTLNYVQLRRTDPLNTKVLKVLTDRLQADPGDESLRQEIRELDLLARKAYFTGRWQVRTGGYLLFASLLVMIICMKSAEMLMEQVPAPPGATPAGFWATRKKTRNWMAGAGAVVMAAAFLVLFLTHRELGLEGIAASEGAGPEGPASESSQPARQSGNTSTTLVTSADTAAGPEQADTAIATEETWPSEAENRSNFPSFRGYGSIGLAWQRNIPVDWDGKSGKQVRWKTEIPLPGYNSPIIWGDKIFLAGASDQQREVFCVSLASGKILWRKPVTVAGGGQAGQPKVIRETGYSASTMTTDGRRVYAIFANGDLAAFDFEGNQVWSKNLGVPQNHYGHSSSLVMFRNLLIVQYDQRGSASVTALEGKTGQTAWQTQRKVKISWASPSLVNTGKRMELVLAADPAVISYDPATGRELWQTECISGEVGPGLAYAGGVFFSVNDYSKLAATEAGSPPRQLWEDSEYLSDIPSPAASGEFLFVVTSYGAIACYDVRSGTRHWEHELGSQVFASPVIAENKVYLMDRKGTMHIFRVAGTYEVIGEPSIGEGSSCTPAFADGRIILRGDKHLFCIGK